RRHTGRRAHDIECGPRPDGRGQAERRGIPGEAGEVRGLLRADGDAQQVLVAGRAAGGRVSTASVPAYATGEAGGFDALRLLIVDDEATDILAVRRSFRDAGIFARIDETTNAAETLDLVGLN